MLPPARARKKCATKSQSCDGKLIGTAQPGSRILGLSLVLSILPFQTNPRYQSFFLLWLYGLGITVRFQAENVILNLVIELHAGVMGHTIVA